MMFAADRCIFVGWRCMFMGSLT